jgi:hypothetical protein
MIRGITDSSPALRQYKGLAYSVKENYKRAPSAANAATSDNYTTTLLWQE